jgi:hypothetical protein
MRIARRFQYGSYSFQYIAFPHDRGGLNRASPVFCGVPASPFEDNGIGQLPHFEEVSINAQIRELIRGIFVHDATPFHPRSPQQ